MKPDNIETVYAVPERWAICTEHRVIENHMHYETAEAATAYLFEAVGESSAKAYQIRRVTWQERERYEHNAALRNPVWHREAWWLDAPNELVHSLHMPKVSETDRSMLAYFRSPDKACLGIRTKIRPGRYLSQFFPHIPEAERQKLALWQETGSRESRFSDATRYPIHFATTREEIARVYETGPASCMDGSHDWDGNDNTDYLQPCEVYAAGDLAIAYIDRADDDDTYRYKPTLCRAICWPAKKIFGRIYPDDSGETDSIKDALFNRLMADGWTQDTSSRDGFNGARILRIPTDGETKYLMPYIDWGYNAHVIPDNNKYFTISQNHSGITGSNTCGFVNARDVDADDRDGQFLCDRCEDWNDDDDLCTVYLRPNQTRARHWCQDCTDSHAFICAGDNEYYSNDHVTSVEVDGAEYTQSYAEDHFATSDYSGDFFDGESVTMYDGETWSADEFDSFGFRCVITDECYPNAMRRDEISNFDIADCVTDDEIATWFADQGITRIDDNNQTELEIAQ